MGVHTRILPLHRREAIEGEIAMLLQRVTLLIERLDRADAPFMDLEEDDDAGGAIEDDPRGEGVGDFGRGLLPDLPRYAVDQTAGPVNWRQAEAEHLRRKTVECI